MTSSGFRINDMPGLDEFLSFKKGDILRISYTGREGSGDARAFCFEAQNAGRALGAAAPTGEASGAEDASEGRPPSPRLTRGLLKQLESPHQETPLQQKQQPQPQQAKRIQPGVALTHVILDCAESFHAAQWTLRRMARLAAAVTQQGVPYRPTKVLQTIKSATKREFPRDSGIFWDLGAAERAVIGGRFSIAPRCFWAGDRMASLEPSTLSRMQSWGAGIPTELEALLAAGGVAPFGLFVGSPGDGQGIDVYALEDVPAGLWVIQWVGEYKQGAVAAEQGLYVFSGAGCAIPVSAAFTDAQIALCASLPHERIPGEPHLMWRRLPGAVVDARRRGNAVRFLRRSGEGANLEAVEIDLPHGPTGVFLCSTRSIAAGEELVLQE